MRLHLLSIPHSVTHRAWSHCAFTQWPLCEIRAAFFSNTCLRIWCFFATVYSGWERAKLRCFTPGVFTGANPSTLTTTAPVSAINRIFWRKCVTAFAMRLGGIYCCMSFTAQQIFTGSYRLKVLWIETGTVSA